MQSSINSETAYVLHKRPYRETSLLVDFFSLEHGRISAIWRAARGAKRRVSSEPFNSLHIGCIGRKELKTLTRVEAKATPTSLLKGKNLYTGLYVNELLYRLLAPYDAHEDIFLAYEQMLEVLCMERNVEPHLRHFELNLLAALGYGISFDVEADDESPISSNHTYRFVAGEGFHRQTGTSSSRIPGAAVHAIATGDWQAPEVLHSLKIITQTALNAQLNGLAPRSREYFRSRKRSQ
ncbi:MAG: DNA repair protein RecO [Pseudomonadales bacterium]